VKVWAVVQARMGSQRLPGKALEEIEGQPMVWHVVDRVSRTSGLEGTILATTSHEKDDPLAEMASSLGIPFFRGSEQDVLDRTFLAAKEFGADVILRVSSDCPFSDPEINAKVLKKFMDGGFDYVSNIHPPTFPDGLDVEVFSAIVLEKAWEEASLPSEREHVTSFIWNRPDRFGLANVECDQDLSALRWTVDEEKDLCFVRQVFAALYPTKSQFGMSDILALLDRRTDLTGINEGISRNQGYQRSLEAD